MSNPTTTQGIHEAFGQYPEDVIMPAKTASDTCDWLAEVFRSIAEEAKRKTPGQARILHLAEMGAYLAADFGAFLDNEHDQMFKALKQAGEIPADQVRRPEWSAFGLE